MSRATRTMALVAACGSLLLTGCSASFSVGGNTLSTETLETQITEQLTKTVGQAPDSVSCANPLKAEVGESERCELTAADTRYGVTVTVTSVEGDKAKFDIQVDNEPMK
ncbi:DUF4333 domain-containing protein [Saccharopolyspora sp. NPDC002376]